MYNRNICTDNLLPTGVGKCVSDLAIVVKVIPVKDGFSFETETLAKTESEWEDAVQNGDIYPFPLAINTTNADEEAVIEKGNTGRTHKVREGKAENTYEIITDLCTHRRLRSFDGFSGKYYALDENNNVLGTSSDDSKFEPFTIDQMSVNKMTASDGSTGRKTPVYIVDADPTEFNDRGVGFKATWLKGMNGLLPVSLEVVSASATEIVVNALTSCDGSVVSGLETATDWVLTDGQTISAAAESASVLGQYTLSGTGLVSGTLNLGDPSVLSVTGYESVGAVTLTVS